MFKYQASIGTRGFVSGCFVQSFCRAFEDATQIEESGVRLLIACYFGLAKLILRIFEFDAFFVFAH